MEKNKLLLFPFIGSLLLVIYSWYISYPVSTTQVNDYIFNHISVFYWIGLPILIVSMFLISLTSNNAYVKWGMAIGIVTAMYSTVYFYFMMPTSDSQYFRGLNEFVLQSKNISFHETGKIYFQWPLLFIFTYLATGISGLSLNNFEFLVYWIIGFLMVTSIFVYASKFSKKAGIFLIVTFYIAMLYYLNYQFCAFSLAFSLLFILFLLSLHRENPSLIVAMIFLFIAIALTHLYTPLFFILFLFAQFILTRDRSKGILFLLFTAIYLIIATTIAEGGFYGSLVGMTRLPTELSSVVASSTSLSAVHSPIDVIAQQFSTLTLVITVGLCVSAFVFLLLKKKLRKIDYAILFAGIAWVSSGIFYYTLASRAFPLLFLPIALSVVYLYQTKIKKYLIPIVLIVLITFTAIPIHLSFYNAQIQYQTRSSYTTDNFLIVHYDWTKRPLVLAEFFESQYLQNKMNNSANIVYNTGMMNKSQLVVFDLALQNEYKGSPGILESSLSIKNVDIVYNNGESKLTLIPNHP
jgi:hypothetical protein